MLARSRPPLLIAILIQGRIASLLADPRVHGCALIRGLLDKPDAFGVRKELVHKALVTLYKLMWDKWDVRALRCSACPMAQSRVNLAPPAGPQRLGRRIKFYILHSEKVRKESAWVDFKVRGSCLEEGRTVLFPPYSNDVSIYVNHPDAVEVRAACAETWVLQPLTCPPGPPT